jgi:carboxyl-terminal processing protease
MRNGREMVVNIKRLAVLSLLGILVSCGGGGGGSSPTSPAAASSASSASLAHQCLVPRTLSADQPGSLDAEKSWLRAFMHETYLWYKDIPDVDAASFTMAAYGNSEPKTMDAYLQALKTKKTTASGKLVDQFSHTFVTADLQNQQAGFFAGYGMRLTAFTSAVPRAVRVLFVEPGSAAQLAGVSRGDTITSVNGVDINDATDAGAAALSAALTPAGITTTRFGLRAPDATESRVVSITSSPLVAVTPVPVSKVIQDGGNTVGYLVLHYLIASSAEQQLVDAVTAFKKAQVNELVLDLRYNPGGYLGLANELASMLGGASVRGQTFDKYICNDRNPSADCNATIAFTQTTYGYSVPMDQPLPQLGLRRVFVLTSGNTCSASEAVINGLSPFVQVIRIGSTTCGKPYGYAFTDNCGVTYAAMQFHGVNAQGFGDYADGFTPTCPVADDLTRQLGDPAELMLSGALSYARTGACPVATPGAKSATHALLQGSFAMQRNAVEDIGLGVAGGPGVRY